MALPTAGFVDMATMSEGRVAVLVFWLGTAVTSSVETFAALYGDRWFWPLFLLYGLTAPIPYRILHRVRDEPAA